jgi:hypothetical protein
MLQERPTGTWTIDTKKPSGVNVSKKRTKTDPTRAFSALEHTTA